LTRTILSGWAASLQVCLAWQPWGIGAWLYLGGRSEAAGVVLGLGGLPLAACGVIGQGLGKRPTCAHVEHEGTACCVAPITHRWQGLSTCEPGPCSSPRRLPLHIDVHLHLWNSGGGAYAILVWIGHTYNRRRRQRSLGKLTPVEFELAFTTVTEKHRNWRVHSHVRGSVALVASPRVKGANATGSV